jgi:hypothetical protein
MKFFKKSNNTSSIESSNIIYSRSFTNINYYILHLINYIKLIKKTDALTKNGLTKNGLTKNYSITDDLTNILLRNDSETDILDYKNDSEYVNLFTNNIIFGHYIDCSASNTILECILYNTPIIVNNHPAIVEYLGIDYPLYYSELNYDSKYRFVLDFTLDDIYNAHLYLLNLDKTKFSSETFNKRMYEIFLKYTDKPNKLNNSYRFSNVCKCFSNNKL